jgi:hypothetical protein
MRLIHSIMTVLALFFAAKVGGAENPPPLLDYRVSSQQTAFESKITISSTGETAVTFAKQKEPASRYQTTLTAGELGLLKVLIESTNVLALTNEEVAPNPLERTHSGLAELTIAQGGKTKTLSFSRARTLQPLQEFLWSLQAQAEAIHAIQTDGDLYLASGSVSPRLAGQKVLQREQMKQPLLEYVRTSTNTQKVRSAWEALTWLTTPEEFVGLYAEEAGRNERQEVTLVCLPYQNGSEDHHKELCHFYLAFLRKYQGQPGLGEAARGAIELYPSLLGEYRYVAAIPLLVAWFEQCKQKSPTPAITPLAKMGAEGMSALIPFLDSTDEVKRGNAVQLLVIASRGNPRAGFSKPYREDQYKPMVFLFEKQVLPKLRTMAESDPADWVKKKAETALTEIPTQIAK